MKTSVTRIFTFEAAHQLHWHSGKCKRLHGHSYRLEVTVEGDIGPNGVIVDFADIQAVVARTVIQRYDHSYLNDLIPNPTAELLAQDIWNLLQENQLSISRIRLWETANCMAEVYG